MLEVGTNVKFVSGPRAGQIGTVTAVKGPKTVELRMTQGFSLWNVKVSQLAKMKG